MGAALRVVDIIAEALKNIIACAEKAAKIRKTEERAKTNMLTKQKFSFDSRSAADWKCVLRPHPHPP